MSNRQPLILVDLDDTLFQTHRRRTPLPTDRIATFDKSGEPLSFMSNKQQNMTDWLFANGDVIAITARSVEGLKRVQIQFQHGAVCDHGGAVLQANGELDLEFHAIQQQNLAHLQQRMDDLILELNQLAQNFGAVRTWIAKENDLNLYVVLKQQAPEPVFLADLIKQLPASLYDDFYLHLNGNNLAIIPHSVSKKNAAEFLLNKIDPERQRFCIGFGDSLSDFGFLGLCDWFGMPKNSQLHRFSQDSLDQDYQAKGYFGHA